MKSGIYFLRSEHGAVKIGHSKNIDGRVRALQTAHPGELELIGTIAASVHSERQLHDILSDYRTTGEWFRDCEEVRSIISIVLAEGVAAISSRPRACKDDVRPAVATSVPTVRPQRWGPLIESGDSKLTVARRVMDRIIRLEKIETGSQQDAIKEVCERYSLPRRWVERLIRNEPGVGMNDAQYEQLLAIYEEQINRSDASLQETKTLVHSRRQIVLAHCGTPEDEG